MPYQLRQMFATILIFNNPSNPRNLYEMFKFDLCEDFLPNISKNSKQKSFICGLDWYCSKIKIIESSIKHFVKIHFKKLSLTQNMRADPNAKEFAEWVMFKILFKMLCKILQKIQINIRLNTSRVPGHRTKPSL